MLVQYVEVTDILFWIFCDISIFLIKNYNFHYHY